MQCTADISRLVISDPFILHFCSANRSSAVYNARWSPAGPGNGVGATPKEARQHLLFCAEQPSEI